MRKLLTLSVLLLLIFSGVTGSPQTLEKNNTVTRVTSGEANTLDPHFAYDTASGAILFNIYESLVRWPYGIADGNEYDDLYSLDPNDLKPMLATDWSVSADGKTYTFTIREGVKFHEDGSLTPEDVEYSFERGMLQDRAGGPMWMILEPLTGFKSLKNLAGKVLGRQIDDLQSLSALEQSKIYNQYIDPAVEVSGDQVVFNLTKPYPPFLSILAHGSSWGYILDKEWCISIGCWNGSHESWARWWNPSVEESSLNHRANGTGPFKLEAWEKGTEVKLTRFDNYWREPAVINKVRIKKVDDWATRREMFNNGEADIVYLPPSVSPGVLKDAKVHAGLPTVQMNPAGFFVSQFNRENNEFISSGNWNGYSMPADFFSSLKVRKAFCLAFDYEEFIHKAYDGQGYKTHGPIPKSISWAYNPDPGLIWEQDLEKAEKLLKETRGGEIWEKGFTLPITYNSGNNNRKLVAEILKKNIEGLNEKFSITLESVSWSRYLDLIVQEKLPFFTIGWIADFPDPHNFAVPFVDPSGTFAGWQGNYMKEEIFKPIFDPLVENGITSTSQMERSEAYYEISEKAHEKAIDIWLPQSYGLRVVKNRLQDVPFNPIFGGYYYYPIYKSMSIPYIVTHWNTEADQLDPDLPCELSTNQILQAIAWWADEIPVPNTDDQVISTDQVLELIARWANGKCVG